MGDADAKAVHSIIGTQRGITLNTIQSTLERLHDKGLLRGCEKIVCRGSPIDHEYAILAP